MLFLMLLPTTTHAPPPTTITPPPLLLLLLSNTGDAMGTDITVAQLSIKFMRILAKYVVTASFLVSFR